VGRLVADELTSGRMPDAFRRTRPALYTLT
jgi:hypothetical protein